MAFAPRKLDVYREWARFYIYRMQTKHPSSPMQKPEGAWPWILAVVGVAVIAATVWTRVNDSRILRTNRIPGTVISVVSGRDTRYFIQLEGSRTIIISGPTLPLYPNGTAVVLEQLVHENGTVDYQFPQ